MIGVDWGEEGLGLAERTRAQAGIDGVSFCRADVLDLPFPDGAFEFVFCNGVLHHTSRIQRCLRGHSTDLAQAVAERGEAGRLLWGEGELRYLLRR